MALNIQRGSLVQHTNIWDHSHSVSYADSLRLCQWECYPLLDWPSLCRKECVVLRYPPETDVGSMGTSRSLDLGLRVHEEVVVDLHELTKSVCVCVCVCVCHLLTSLNRFSHLSCCSQRLHKLFVLLSPVSLVLPGRFWCRGFVSSQEMFKFCTTMSLLCWVKHFALLWDFCTCLLMARLKRTQIECLFIIV